MGTDQEPKKEAKGLGCSVSSNFRQGDGRVENFKNWDLF